MKTKVFTEEGYHIIQIIGDLDASSSIQLDDAIEKAVNEGGTKLLFDCGNLDYISSPGIGVFTSRIEDSDKGIKMVLFDMNEKVYNVFKILGLDQLLTIVNGKDKAKEAIDDLQD